MAQPLNRQNNRKGFTLIELLMVIAIIATLATIALPQFQAYRARAYDSAALSDVAQFRAAVAGVDSYTAGGPANWTSGFHPLFTEVSISNLVSINWQATVMNGSQVFIAYSCSTNGDLGYRVIVPYGASYTSVSGEAPNEIVTGNFRGNAGC